MKPRHLVSNMLHYSGVNAFARAVRRDSLAVLCYHRVMDVEDADRASVDPALVTSTHVFERQMEIIARGYHPVTLSEALRWLDGKHELPRRALLVTFDDGVADTYTRAFPIMKRLGIPGVVFLATAFIGTPERQWTEIVHGHVADHSDVRTATQVVERLKRMPSTRREELLQGIADQSLSHGDTVPNISWEQVEEMQEFGFEFGSHTRDHVILPYETDDRIRREVTSSREDIRSRLSCDVEVFAYPDGQFDNRSVSLLSEMGMRAAFTCDEGFVRRSSQHLALPRLLMHDGISVTQTGDFSYAMFLSYLCGTIPRRYRRTVG